MYDHTMINRVDELEDLIPIYKHIYYCGLDNIEIFGKKFYPISDAEFDALEDELRKLKPDSKILEKVGTDMFIHEKVKHDRKMKSIQKTKTIDKINDLAKHGELLATFKLDGSACNLTYINKIFIGGATRGDGEYGENITKYLQYVNIPKFIQHEGKVSVYGEIIITEDNFALLKEEQIARGLDVSKSMRNCVAGLLHRKDNIDLCKYLDFIAYDTSIKIYNYYDKLELLTMCTFKIAPTFSINTELDDIINGYKRIKDTIGILTDGIVFRIADEKIFEDMGETEHHYKGNIAFKLNEETKEVQIRDIVWDVGRTGKLTPVAHIEPTELSGATISKLTLHNAKYLIDHGIYSRSIIEIERSNAIIPKHIKTITRAVDPEFHLPPACPVCSSELSWSDTETDLLCTNYDCGGRHLKKLIHFAKVMDFDGLSEKTIEKLYDEDLICDLEDFYYLDIDDFMSLTGIKEKSASNFVNAIQSKKEFTMDKFLTSLSVPGLGKTVSKLLMDYFKDIDTMIDAIKNDTRLDEIIDGIGEGIDFNIRDYINIIEDELFGLCRSGCRIITKESSISMDNSLNSEVICITGTLSKPRKEIEKMIDDNGGKNTKSVSKNTTILVCNEKSSSSKYKKAEQLGIKIITENELYKIMGV